MSNTIRLSTPIFTISSKIWNDIVSKTGKEIMLYLLENKDHNAYQISKRFLGEIQITTIYKCLETEVKNGYINSIYTREQKRNKKIETNLYRLSKKAFEHLVWSFYLDDVLADDERVNKLKLAFGSANRNYPDFVPHIFKVFSLDYLVVFYPYFYEHITGSCCCFLPSSKESDTLVDCFKLMVEIKNNNPKKQTIFVNNSYFEHKLPLTEKEIKIINDLIITETKP